MAKQYTLEQFKEAMEIVNALGTERTGAKHDVFSTTLTSQSLYNVNPGATSQLGVFTGAGIKPGMFNLTARTPSMTSVIPFQKTTLWNELLETITGVTASAGTNSTSSCAAAPVPGVLKTMRRAFTFGIINMDTRTFDVTQAGSVYNRAVMTREVYNNAAVDNPFIPQLPGINGDGIAANELRASLYALGKGVEDAVVQVNISGVAATSDNTYPGIATQWDGVATQIKTGYTDSHTGLAATSMDSDVVTYGGVITGANQDGTSRTFIQTMNDLLFGRRDLANKLGLGAIQFAWVMRSDLFREVTRRWAEALAFYYVTGAVGTPIPASAMELQNMRMELQNGFYLIMDDNSRIPVIIDDGLPRRSTANNTWQSDILLVPLGGVGIPLIHYEFFDMNNQAAQEIASLGTPGSSIVINNGMYRMFRFETGGCIHWKVFARPRLILDAPFLAGRIDRVGYNTYYKATDAISGMSYFRDGGSSYRLSQ